MNYEKLFNNVLVTLTIALFVGMVFLYPADFSDSFFWNLISVPLYLFGLFFLSGIICIPAMIITVLFERLDEFKKEGHQTIAKVIIVGVCVLVVLALTVFATVKARGVA